MPRILLAETSAAFCPALKRALPPDYKIHTARSGAQALALLEKLRPDALIISLQLPPTNGVAVLRAMKHKPPAVIALTTVATESVLREVSCLGVDHVIMRPCAMDFVAKVLEELCVKSPTPGC